MLMKAISLDSQAVQRHRATILECVKVSCDHILFYFLLISLPSKSPVFYGFICFKYDAFYGLNMHLIT